MAPNISTYLGTPFDYTNAFAETDATFDNFRTVNTREIAADPTRPGVLYAVAASGLDEQALNNFAATAADGIMFAVSYDYGQSWTTNFTVGSEASITRATDAQRSSTTATSRF